jgi:hypothetical protein
LPALSGLITGISCLRCSMAALLKAGVNMDSPPVSFWVAEKLKLCAPARDGGVQPGTVIRA